MCGDWRITSSLTSPGIQQRAAPANPAGERYYDNNHLVHHDLGEGHLHASGLDLNKVVVGEEHGAEILRSPPKDGLASSCLTIRADWTLFVDLLY